MVVVERINSVALGSKGKQLFHFFQEEKGNNGYEETKSTVLAILTNLWFQKNG